MTRAALSPQLRRFLLDIVVSIEGLTVLLCMHRHPERWRSALEVSAELKMPVEAAQAEFERLSAHNLLDVRVASSLIYRYKPGREDLARLVNSLAHAHLVDHAAVIAALPGQRLSSRRRKHSADERPR